MIPLYVILLLDKMAILNQFHRLSPVHANPEEFENGGFTLKTHQMFSVHTTPEEFENTAITGHFGILFE